MRSTLTNLLAKTAVEQRLSGSKPRKAHNTTCAKSATRKLALVHLRNRLKKGLDNRVSAQFATMQMAGVDAGESKVFATLGAATNLLVDLEAVETEVSWCSCPHWYHACGVFRIIVAGVVISSMLMLSFLWIVLFMLFSSSFVHSIL